MLARFSILLLLQLGLIFGSVPAAATCAVDAPQACASCCAEAEMACCAAPAEPASQPPISATASSVEGKQLAAPVLVVLCLRPEPVTETVVAHQRQVAQMVVSPRVDVTCIRLI